MPRVYVSPNYGALSEADRKKAARKARDSRNLYTVYATGKTYPVKDDLQAWAFFWDADNRQWVRESASEWDRFMFEIRIADGPWFDVVLRFEKTD